MGQKVNSHSLRIGINKAWDSKWFDTRPNYSFLLQEDIKMRNYVLSFAKNLNILVGSCKLKKSHNKIVVSIEIYQGDSNNLINLKNHESNIIKQIEKLTQKEVRFNIFPLNNYTDSAQLLANYLADLLERRRSYKDLLRIAITESRTNKNIKGIRINCSGRLDGAEIARTEWIREGQVPLQTLRANVDYATSEAFTIYGVCGIKIWICYK